MTTWKSQNYKDLIENQKTDKGKVIKLKKFILPELMTDTEIQQETNAKPIKVNDFIVTIDEFLKTASKDEWHIFHVDNGKGVVAVDVRWRAVEWRLRARGLDFGIPWDDGHCFFSPATDTLTLESRVEKLEEEVKSLRKFLVF